VQLKEKTNGMTTLNFGWPNIDFKKRGEKKGGRWNNIIGAEPLWIGLHMPLH
jgi:hypothetical protein